jgi:dTDP-4-dehydrorhamnose reductase
MKTILITGARGMLGRALREEFESGWRVVEHDIQEGDIRDLDGLVAFFREAKPDLVVNSAAMTDVDGCESDAALAYSVNGIGARNVALAAAEQGARVVHVSTDFVFDGTKGEAYLEYDEPRPLGVYGGSKLWGERLVRDHVERFFIVRTQWLYGAGGKNFVDTIRDRARAGGPLRVVDDQTGCPTSTTELARAIRRIAEEGGYGIWHASGNGSCTWFEFARAIVRGAGASDREVEPMSSAELDRPARRPVDSRLRNFHMEISIGDAMAPWEDALTEYLERS